MAVLGLNSKASVTSLSTGDIAVWAGTEDDPHGVAMSPALALEMVRDVLALAAPADPRPQGVIEKVGIVPPAGFGLTARLTVTIAGRPAAFLMAWDDLAALANAASDALQAATAEGEG